MRNLELRDLFTEPSSNRCRSCFFCLREQYNKFFTTVTGSETAKRLDEPLEHSSR